MKIEPKVHTTYIFKFILILMNKEYLDYIINQFVNCFNCNTTIRIQSY